MRIKRRLAVVCALATTVALGAVGVAHAINASSTESFAITPSTTLGSTGKQVKLNLHTHTNYTVAGTKTTRAKLFFDKNIVFSLSSVPKCPTASVSGNITMGQANTACASSLVGTGTAAANLSTPSDTKGCVLVFNAKDANPDVAGDQPGILLFTRLGVASPAPNCAKSAWGSGTNGNTSILLQAPLATSPASTTPGGPLPAPYFQGGKWLDFNHIPQALPLADFNVTAGKGAPNTNLTGTKANFIKAKCTLRSGVKNWKMRTLFTYNSGSPLTQAVNSTKGPCT
jgi:hypothetical protein